MVGDWTRSTRDLLPRCTNLNRSLSRVNDRSLEADGGVLLPQDEVNVERCQAGKPDLLAARFAEHKFDVLGAVAAGDAGQFCTAGSRLSA